MQRDLVIEALRMAPCRCTPASDLMHHSDRGTQYASEEFQRLLKAHGIICSMSGSGNCFDKSVAESFFATLKRERVHRCQYQTRAEATADLFYYFEIFYNRQGRHSKIGQKIPEFFELETETEYTSWN